MKIPIRLHAKVRSTVPSLLLAGFAVAMVLLVPLLPSAQAASGVVLSGRVYNADSGTGYSGVSLNLCSAGTATTGANGNWQLTVPSGAYYCVRLGAGAPAGLAGPIVRNNPDVGATTSYENQQAGVDCYHSASCPAALQSWDRAIDGGLDFAFSAQAPAAAPVSAPASMPVPSTSAPAPASDPSAAPAAPTNFTATPTGDGNHTIKLTWQSAGDPAASAGYQLDRSIDQLIWTPVFAKLTAITYTDSSLDPGVHYYYRLAALSSTGTPSDYALADASTGTVLAATTQRATTYTSADGVAIVTMPAGTIPAGATCTLNLASAQPPVHDGGRTLIVGPYQLVCRDAAGAATITSFQHPVSWQFKLGNKLRGYTSPVAVQQSGSNQPQTLSGANYNAKTTTLTITAPATGQLAVLAALINYAWVNYVVIGGLVLTLLLVIALVPIRSSRRLNYREYLRSKYYNL